MIRPGILERLLAREFAAAQAAVALLILLVIVGGVLGRVLRDVAEGSIPLDMLPTLVGLGSFKALVLFYPVALFFAFLFVLGRFQRDSELIAMQAGGVSFARMYRSIFMVALPAALILLLLVWFAVPRVEAGVDRLRDLADQRSDLVGITPGRFLRARAGQQVFFAEAMSPDREALLNVFIYEERGGKAEVVVARRARADLEADSRFIVLEQGMRYVGTPGEAAFQLLEFERLRMEVPDPTIANARRKMGGLTMSELWEHRYQSRFRAELEWRVAVPVSVLVLALLALPLGLMAPRSGRFSRMPAGILVYAVYANVTLLAKSWIEDGAIPLWLGLWWVHLIPLAVWLVLCRRRCLWPSWPQRLRERTA